MRCERRFGNVAPRLDVLPAYRLRQARRPVDRAAAVQLDEPFPNVTEWAWFFHNVVDVSDAVLRGEFPRGDFILAGDRLPDARTSKG